MLVRTLHCNTMIPSPNGKSVIVGSRRYVILTPEREYLDGGDPWSAVLVPIEVPEEHRKMWAAGFLAGSSKRVHDVDLPRTCDDPVCGWWVDPQPNIKKPLSEERR